jgi:hypothetical protein
VLELIIALLLIGHNGLFSLSELAVVSARRFRLKAMGGGGKVWSSRRHALKAMPAAQDVFRRPFSSANLSADSSPSLATGEAHHHQSRRTGREQQRSAK